MAATESDFTGLSLDGIGAYLGDDANWPAIARAVQALNLFFVQKHTAGTEPTDVLIGLSIGEGTDHHSWRLFGSGGDLLIQENTGTEGTPVWTTRTTFTAAQAGIDHGGLFGLADDDHTQYSLADGSRAITGSQQFDVDVKTNTIIERTAASGVTVDGCLIKDGSVADSLLVGGVAEAALALADGSRAITGSQQFDTNVKTDTIIEKTASGGVTIDGIISNLKADFVSEKTTGAGVTIDGSLIKDTQLKIDSIIEENAASGVTVDGTLIKDGTIADSLLLNGVSTYSRLDLTEEYTAAKGHTENTGSISSGVLTLDFEASNYFEISLTENITTVTINNTGKPGTRVVKFKQDATGGRTVTGYTSVNWVGGTEVVITTAANSIDFVTFVVDSAGAMFAFVAQDFS